MSCEALIKAIDAYIRKADDSLKEELEDAGYVKPKKTVDELIKLEEEIAEVLRDNTDVMLEYLLDADDLQAFADDIWPKLKKDSELGKKLQEVFQREMETFLPDVLEQYTKQIDPQMTTPEMTMRTVAWVEGWSEELGQIMELNTHDEVEAIITAGLENGQSISEVTQALMDSGIRDEHYKARRAAITEVLTAHSVAREESIIQSPAVDEKEWIHTGSHQNEPRANHEAMSGQRVPKEEPFELQGEDGGTYYPMYPRDTILPPGERINCHCIHRGIVNEDILGLPLEERQRLQAEAIAADNDEWEKELDAQNKAKAGIET